MRQWTKSKKEKIVLRREVFMMLLEVLCWHWSGEIEDQTVTKLCQDNQPEGLVLKLVIPRFEAEAPAA
jgi:hypothetical protein